MCIFTQNDLAPAYRGLPSGTQGVLPEVNR
jgi:hypothetical protein